ncbi:MAG: M15 family peptidase [Dehalococcoidia bacterium]
MPSFSDRSKAHLKTCHPDLQQLFNDVVEGFDCTIVEGHRGEVRQNRLFREGKSKLQYPDGEHNKSPSHAVDVVPYPIDWHDTERMVYFAGYVKATARKLEIAIRWGGDWDGDTDLSDNRFRDFPHFELVETPELANTDAI